MGIPNKGYSLLLVIVLAVSSLIMVESASAQSIPTPSVPDFTINITHHSSDTPSTVSTDPFTGANVTNPGSHYEWQTLDLTIKNQPFTQDAYGIEFYYFIRMKGHFSTEWNSLVVQVPHILKKQEAKIQLYHLLYQEKTLMSRVSGF